MSLDFGISLGATASLTGWSERTVWRRLRAGAIVRYQEVGIARLLLSWGSVAPHARLQFPAEDLLLLRQADAGDGQAQAEFGLVLLAVGRPAGGLYWLQLAAAQGEADAMHWLSRCHFNGEVLPQDFNLGLMYLAQAAAHGHVISRAMLGSLCQPFFGQMPGMPVGPVPHVNRLALPALLAGDDACHAAQAGTATRLP
jgi:uncharacterized protein